MTMDFTETTRVILLLLLRISAVIIAANANAVVLPKVFDDDSSSGDGASIDPADIIRQAMTVECADDRVTVTVDYSSERRGAFTRQAERLIASHLELFAGDDVEADDCRAVQTGGQSTLEVALQAGRCGTSVREDDQGTVFQTTISIKHSAMKVNTSETVICVRYRDSLVNELIENQTSTLLQQKYSDRMIVKEGDTLLFRISPSKVIKNRSDIHSYPTECHLSKSADESVTGYLTFIKNGCINRGSSIRWNSYDDHMPMKIGFTLPHQSSNDADWLVEGIGQFRTRHMDAYIHCRAITCFTDIKRPIANLPHCPLRGDCHNTDPARMAVRKAMGERIREHRQGHTTIPLRVMSAANPTADSACKRKCQLRRNVQQPQAVSPRADRLTEENSDAVTVLASMPAGTSAWVVLVVSLASFCVGMLLMASIWFIHVHTDPYRKLAHTSYSSIPTTVSTELASMAPSSKANQRPPLLLTHQSPPPAEQNNICNGHSCTNEVPYHPEERASNGDVY